MKNDPLARLFISKPKRSKQTGLKPINMPIAQHDRLYVNFARFRDGTWGPCWYPQWLGATNFKEAVRLRREFLSYLRADGRRNTVWPLDSVKTVRII